MLKNGEIIGAEKAQKVAVVLLDKIEHELSALITKEVRDHMIPQIAGLLTRLYVRESDGYLGHMGIEKTIVHLKQDELNKKKKKKK